jgi:hypothetical protein
MIPLIPLSVQKVAAGAAATERVGKDNYVCVFPPRGDGMVVSYLIRCDGNETTLVQHFVRVNAREAMRAVDLYLAQIREKKSWN